MQTETISISSDNKILENLVIRVTTDYFLFKPIHGNRVINQLHLKRLRDTFSKRQLFSLIVVNERYEIIDGQHRFEIYCEKQLPIYYVIIEGYGLDEVHILNQNTRTWTNDDYAVGYEDLGNENYRIYNQFRKEYNLPHELSCTLLSGVSVQSHRNEFQTGLFKVNSYDNAVNMIQRLEQIKDFYPKGYRRRIFVFAMIKLAKNPNFDFDIFIKKLERQPTALKDCTTVESTIALIESIYNYHNHNKVNLRINNY